ncbi:glucosaminidase domain-containing protein [Clostridium perfringens]|uniref:glucosaminidase domain-containing protein n=2 Tax=Clostridium perfringens TaxID=1502 RepID=UPI0032DB8596
MIKKFILATVITLSVTSINVLASENVNDKSDENKSSSLVGETYEIVKEPNMFFSIPGDNVESYKDENGIEREEFKKDKEGQESINRLVTKTKSKYEIALAHENGKYTFLDSANTKEEAEKKVENASEKYNTFAAMPVVLNDSGQVAYSEKSMGRLVKYKNGSPAGYGEITNIYANPNLTNDFTYINHGYVDDVPIIEDRGNVAKIEVGGYEGWVNKDTSSGNYDLVIVPLNQVKNPSYYIVRDGELIHYISSDLTNYSEGGYEVVIGPAPNFLSENVKYYSYDNKYFYKDLSTLIGDLQNDNHNNSVNANNPFYPYYMNLPFRSKTTFTAEELNNFIDKKTKSYSKLRGTGQAFIDAQDKYGANALLLLGLAANESAWGTSQIAQQKNNLFGINAIDSSPGASANSFETVEGCINDFAKYYISRGYSDPEDWRYFGGYLGNKGSGANVKYASDPFWGEKAGQNAYIADYWASGKGIAGLKDYNYYQLGIYTGASSVTNKDNEKLYDVGSLYTERVEKIGATTILTSKEKINHNGKDCYEINPVRTTPVISNGSPVAFPGPYDWNDKGFVDASKVKLINEGKHSENVIGKWVMNGGIWYYYLGEKYDVGLKCIDGYWYYFNQNGEMQIGWQKIDGKWYYFRPDGNMRIGWEEINGYWYYFGSNGAMQTGWQELGGTWYYFRTDGNMKVGWEEIDGKWYYFATDGVLETNKVVGDWYVNNDGVGNQIVTEGVYGKSGKGRDLEYYRIGHGKKVLFSVFGVHGYEDAWSGDSQELKIIAEKSVNRLRSEYNTKGIDLSEWSVYIIPSANPDGRIDGWTNNGPGRTTVTTKNDINRSFPTGFTPFYSARNYTGPTALGSPEAKALYGFINKTMEGATEKVLLDVHGWENKTIGNPSIARYFDNEFGFRNINKYPGGFVITYGNAIGAKSVLVEFPVPYSHQDILRRDFSGKFANGLVNILLNN